MLGLPTETKEEVLKTISMLKQVDPDYYSPAFFTPHPGSDLYAYCTEHDLSLIRSHDDYSRNPDGAKIGGVDYEWLQWALRESQQRTVSNRLKRQTRQFVKRYAQPTKLVRKLGQILSVGG